MPNQLDPIRRIQAAEALARRVKELGPLVPMQVFAAARQLSLMGKAAREDEMASAVSSVLTSLGNAEVGRHSWYTIPLDQAARHARAVFRWRPPAHLPHHEPDMAAAPYDIARRALR